MVYLVRCRLVFYWNIYLVFLNVLGKKNKIKNKNLVFWMFLINVRYFELERFDMLLLLKFYIKLK